MQEMIDLKDNDVSDFLLSKGADANAADVDGSTPLHWAAARGNMHMCNAVLEHGVCVDQADSNGGTALLCAAIEGRAPTCVLLLGNGASVDRAIAG